jgi:hypothetical protein
LALAVSACGRPADKAAAPPPVLAQDAEAGYLAPPQLLGATRIATGVRLSGQAAPGARIRLAAPEGDALGATAGPDGSWSLDVPLAAQPRMFSLAAEADGHVLRAEGAVIAAPGTAFPALLARAGAAAWPAGEGKGAPEIVSIDHDGAGGASVGGLAAPDAAVRLTIDGAQAGQGQADARGRFAVPVTSGPVRPGVHAFTVQTNAGTDLARIELSPPTPLEAPYRAARAPGGWRIDWAPPGGGVQTSLVLDQGSPAP